MAGPPASRTATGVPQLLRLAKPDGSQVLMLDKVPLATQVLANLTLSAYAIPENSPPGTVIGTVQGKTAGSQLTLADDKEGRFALSGSGETRKLVTGLANIDYEAGAQLVPVLREASALGSNSPHDTPVTVTVVNVPEAAALLDLTLSQTTLTLGQAASGTVDNVRAGSVLNQATGLPQGLTVNLTQRTWAWDGAGSAATPTIHLREALDDSPNSPHVSDIALVIQAIDGVMRDDAGNFMLADDGSYILAGA